MKQKRKHRITALLAAMLLLASVVMIFGGCVNIPPQYSFSVLSIQTNEFDRTGEIKVTVSGSLNSENSLAKHKDAKAFLAALPDSFSASLKVYTNSKKTSAPLANHDARVIYQSDVVYKKQMSFQMPFPHPTNDDDFVYTQKFVLPSDIFRVEQGGCLALIFEIQNLELLEGEGLLVSMSIPYEIRQGRVVLLDDYIIGTNYHEGRTGYSRSYLPSIGKTETDIVFN